MKSEGQIPSEINSRKRKYISAIRFTCITNYRKAFDRIEQVEESQGSGIELEQ